MKWIVQEYVQSASGRCWQDLEPDEAYRNEWAWEAGDAGEAFKLAVLENRWHKIKTTTYRVLPHTGGASFNLAVNVDAAEHSDTPAEQVKS